MHTSQFLIGAASSGSGKTTFTLGLLRALKNRGLKVQPFKCGPDYLDTKHHAAAAGQTSYNLDTFMASATHVQEVYARHSRTADICITEGVMGLFDGYDNMAGSSAELAGLLHLPVILVVNARSTAYTVAAILYGFKSQELYSTSSVPNRITPTCNKPAGMPASKHWDICPNAKASKYPPATWA